MGDFRVCRGSVATLYKLQNEDLSFPAEVAEMSGLMNGCAHAESLVPPIEGRVRQLGDSIEVSEDTAEAGTGDGDEGAGVADGEVDQPVSSFGISMSGILDFKLSGLARPRFTFGSEAVRRLIGSCFACGRFPPGSFRFKVRDLAPAYMTCMERTEHSPETVWSADQNFRFLV
ncbi:hypothetical protein F2Q69_00030858 [Brassica cretica]|uniref:Uncharacterized protein n=1 Tax=Brassica cretica TaxID=69181 RepID=A0A8S9S8X5_BRACR|nr:hypothetical protein F2Q69_00030858 [Brassica cretica]